MNSARSGSLPPVAESDERNSSGSLHSGDSSFLEYEAQFRRPGRPLERDLSPSSLSENEATTAVTGASPPGTLPPDYEE